MKSVVITGHSGRWPGRWQLESRRVPVTCQFSWSCGRPQGRLRSPLCPGPGPRANLHVMPRAGPATDNRCTALASESDRIPFTGRVVATAAADAPAPAPPHADPLPLGAAAWAPIHTFFDAASTPRPSTPPPPPPAHRPMTASQRHQGGGRQSPQSTRDSGRRCSAGEGNNLGLQVGAAWLEALELL